MEFLIVTGMSGAGKGTANHILEDLGYLCVDNIPFVLLQSCIDHYQKADRCDKISFTLDIRGEEDFSGLMDLIRRLKSAGDILCRLLFLDASDDAIIARYQESRHLHPFLLKGKLPLVDAIARERRLLADLRESADLVLDTTGLRPIEAREQIEEFLQISRKDSLQITCMSFGFKHGVPAELDLQFDVRCFENPFYIPHLKHLTGLDAPVREFVLGHPDTVEFTDKLFGMMDFLIPRYLQEGKSRLTIGIGCTGGQHRSVAITEALAAHLQNSPALSGIPAVQIIHRDCKGIKSESN